MPFLICITFNIKSQFLELWVNVQSCSNCASVVLLCDPIQSILAFVHLALNICLKHTLQGTLIQTLSNKTSL